ncbi:MAG TPA: AI-2E family transporter [Nitrospirales bacterium]
MLTRQHLSEASPGKAARVTLPLQSTVPEYSADLPATPDGQRRFPMGSLPLTVLAVLGIVLALQVAQSLFIPLVFAVLISYALNPLVDWFSRWKVPRPVTAAVLLLALIAAVGSSFYFLSDDAVAILDNVPLAAQNLREKLHHDRLNGPGAVEKMQKAAKEIEKAAAEAAGAKPPSRNVPPASGPLDLSPYLVSGSLGVVALIGQAVLVMFLVYFILASGDLYKRKLVKIAGETLSKKRLTVEILDDINTQIARFLFVQLFTSGVAAVLTWGALAALGMEHAGAWGIAAGVANFIPYVGPLVVAGLITFAGFIQFDTLSMAALIGVISLAIKGFVGFLLTPWLMSKAAKMNPVAAFVGLLFWGWIWGIWGMLLSMPMIMIAKVIFDRIDSLKEIGELLGD